MRDLVFVKFNSKLQQKRENKSRDPIEKEIDDVLADNCNEFITGLVPANEEEKEVPESANDGARTSQSQGVSISQPQAKRKRPVPVRPRKKKLRSLKSLLSDDSEKAAASASSDESKTDQDADISMEMNTSDSTGDDQMGRNQKLTKTLCLSNLYYVLNIQTFCLFDDVMNLVTCISLI